MLLRARCFWTAFGVFCLGLMISCFGDRCDVTGWVGGLRGGNYILRVSEIIFFRVSGFLESGWFWRIGGAAVGHFFWVCCALVGSIFFVINDCCVCGRELAGAELRLSGPRPYLDLFTNSCIFHRLLVNE